MKYVLILVLAVSQASCLNADQDPETDDRVDDTGDTGGSEPDSPVWGEADPKPGPCDTVASYGEGDLKVELPVPCDPYWFDRGDPPPDMTDQGPRKDPFQERTYVLPSSSMK
jgi:hypothetical protein